MTTLTEINRKIAKLQKQADALKRREKKGVVERIKVAIEHYGITAAELGIDGARRRGRPPAATSAEAPATRARKGRGARRTVAVRYRDAVGNTWSGRGKRPNWFKAELAAGRTPEDLLVKTSEQQAG